MTDGLRWTEFPAILDEIMDGKRALPNFEEVPLEKGVANIAAGGGLCGHVRLKRAKLPGDTYGTWARFFLGTTQGGAMTGDGYVMFYDVGKGRIGRFAICEHEPVEGKGANHTRGWHPARCPKCGLDMTVDSSD